ncbi:hypothetical protein NECID01_0913 [Nematocida sp. AWRm77]|nr:hypothetical protein NECID01_0913 [Nematocida sp. AWRm77]
MKTSQSKSVCRKTFFLLSSLSLFSFFFVYDSPSPMYPGLEQTFGKNYSSSHNLLYSAYALPNLLLPVLVSTRITGPTTRMMCYTYALIVLGQAVMCFGAYINTFEVLVAGRFIIGLGGESFSVAQNHVLSALFKNHEYGRVFSLSIAIARLGSISSYLIMGKLITNGVFVCTVVGLVFICIGGVLCVVIDRLIDTPLDAEQECTTTASENHYLLPHILGITIVVACAVSPFYSSSSAILQRRLGVEYKVTSRLQAVQEVVSLVFTVLISAATDKYGHRLSCVVVGSVMLSLSHALILSSTALYYLPSVLIGLSSGFLACCWPCIPLLISPNRLSMGLSFLSCGVNLAYTLCPWIVGKLTDPEFKGSEYYTVVMSALAGVLSLAVIWINTERGFGLNGKRYLKI